MRSADVSWSMNDGGNWVSAGPSAVEFMADHWLPKTRTLYEGRVFGG